MDTPQQPVANPADDAPSVSRRRVIGAALGAVAAGAAATLGVAGTAAAAENVGTFNSDVTDALTATTTVADKAGVVGITTATSPSITSAGVLGQSSNPVGAGVRAEYVGDLSGMGIALRAKTAAEGGVAIQAEATGTYGVAVGASAPIQPMTVNATVDGGLGIDVGVMGPNAIGIRAVAFDGSAAGRGTGVIGMSGPGGGSGRINTGVYGYADEGTGGYFEATGAGTAIQAQGRVRVNRGGRVSVAAGKTYADLDLSAKGGISASTIIVAMIQTYRTGVAIASVRKNYPSTGKARVYLTKVASTTKSTTVGWVAIEA